MYISVVPALRTPFGVDVFDYRVDDDTPLRPGDLIRVPFRRRETTALVVSRSPTSDFAARAVTLTTCEPLLHFPASVIPTLDRLSERTFTSRPTILQSWLREIPKRATPHLPSSTFHLPPSAPNGTDITEYVLHRASTVMEHAKKSHGRILIITPWKNRADAYAKELNGSVLHADIATTAAWNAWTSFVTNEASILVTTRVGAWLASCADTVIIDEPENDDLKQDELTPRFDSRWIASIANLYRPHLSVIRVGTTPMVSADPTDIATIPTIDVPVSYEPWSRGNRSSVEGVSGQALIKIEEAVQDNRSVVILHPIAGERGRIVCRDCGWQATCVSCGFPLSKETGLARCRRCGKKQESPAACPTCGGSDLNRSRPGKDRLAEQITRTIPGDIRVVDLPDWHASRLPMNALVVVTDLSLIGGMTEDIRRRERLVIAWRRLAAAVANGNGELLVQGPEELLVQAPQWLTSDGVKTVWRDECRDRRAFKYPPAARLIKLLVDGEESSARSVTETLQGTIPSSWELRGPFAVPFRSNTRRPRFAINLLPSEEADDAAIQAILEPVAKLAIIDLDPIAFFS